MNPVIDHYVVHSCIPLRVLHPDTLRNSGYVVFSKTHAWDGRKKVVLDKYNLSYSDKEISPQTILPPNTNKLIHIGYVFGKRFSEKEIDVLNEKIREKMPGQGK